MTKKRVLVVGDDAALRATLARWLIAAGHSVELAESARHARKVLANERIALAIAAQEQPDDHEFACELRGAVDRLIVVAAASDATTQSAARAVRADSYITRPLREEDVLARVDAVLKADTNAAEAAPELLRFAGYTLDIGQRSCLDASGRVMALTRAELTLLLSLARRPGCAVSRDELTRAVAGRGAERGDRSVDVLISRLRRKTEPDPKSPRLILTVPGVGYMLAAQQQPSTCLPPAPNPAVIATPSDTAAIWSACATAAGESDSQPRQRPLGAKALGNIGRLAAIVMRTLRLKVSSTQA